MLDDTRAHVVLGLADELIESPLKLAAYAAAFGETDDATLVIYAPDRAEHEVVPCLLRALKAAGVPAGGGPDMLVQAIPASAGVERELARRAHALFSDRPATGPLGALDRAGLLDLAALRAPVVERSGGQPGDPVVPVIMCVWQRIEFLPATLALLERQVGVRPELHLWVNNAAVADDARRLGEQAAVPVDVTVSPENVGGFGRFNAARDLAAEHPYVIFIDDDQTFDERALRVLLDEARPRTICAQYAFQLQCPHSYWQRGLPRPGDWVQYAGTGGMVVDTSVFTDERLFDCPEQFRFVEDLWLSYVADHQLGWSLVRSAARFAQVPDGRDQWSAMPVDFKTRFLRHLVDRGWRVPLRAPSTDCRPWPPPPGAGCDCSVARAA